MKEDRHGVHLEGLPDAQQQLVQELLEPELGERRVAQSEQGLDTRRRGQRRVHRREDRLAGLTGGVMVRILQRHRSIVPRAAWGQQA
jgi:hypothetical protein